jgi:hypothetical protein
MSTADLTFMTKLFDLAMSIADAEDYSFGFDEVAEGSPLNRDDLRLEGWWASHVIAHSLGSALDHIITFREMLNGPDPTITNHAPWTLMRGVLEPASLALWIVSGKGSDGRCARALTAWHHDFKERGKWEADTGKVVAASAVGGGGMAREMLKLATSLGLDPRPVTNFYYSQVVADAAEATGLWDRRTATARWREASAFAHGRSWPLLNLSEPTAAERIRGGYNVRMTLDEVKLAEVARLASDVLEAALDGYATLAVVG